MAMLMAMSPRRSVSIAQARDRLPALVHAAEKAPVEIHRRGKPVAVLVSLAEFERLNAEGKDPWAGLLAFRARHAPKDDGVAAALAGTRDRRKAREFRW